MPLPFRKLLSVLLLLPASSASFAQALRSSAGELEHPKAEVFVGYSYFRPNAADINNQYFRDSKVGGEVSLTYFLKPWLGVQLEGGAHLDTGDNVQYSTAGLGVKFQRNMGHFVPFAHVLGGANYIYGPALNPRHLGYSGTGGIGVDWVPSYAHEWFGVRLIQADYQYNHNDFGPLILPGGLRGGVVKMNTMVGSAGVVFRFGTHPVAKEEPQMSCSVDHVEIQPGEPVNVNSQYLGFDVRQPIQFSWNTTGGRIAGGGETINIDTTGLGPGEYRVTGNMLQGGRHGASAGCQTAFAIRQPQPPTVSCIASPATIALGASSTVTATGASPQGRPLVYTFVTSSGTVVPTGNTANVRPANTGDITITCNATDDQGRSATATTTVTVTGAAAVSTAAPVSSYAPLPLQRDLCTVGFDRDRRRPARVDNEAKACLDDVALTLQRDQDASLVLIGDHAGGEPAARAAERAANVKLYLTREKDIDPARIQLRGEDTGNRRVQSILIPAGATFADEGTPLNEAQIRRTGEAYGTRRSGPVQRRRTTRRRVRRSAAAPAQ